MAKEQVTIRVIQTAGVLDFASEVEARLVSDHIGLFHVQPYKAGSRARAELELVRASDPRTLYRALTHPGADLIHLISHGTPTEIQCGLNNLKPEAIKAAVSEGALANTTVLCTACHFGEVSWRQLVIDHLKADALIASKNALKYRDNAVFTTCFYNAYLGQTHRGYSQAERSWRSFRLAYGGYRSYVSNNAERTKIDFYPYSRSMGRKLTNTIDL